METDRKNGKNSNGDAVPEEPKESYEDDDETQGDRTGAFPYHP